MWPEATPKVPPLSVMVEVLVDELPVAMCSEPKAGTVMPAAVLVMFTVTGLRTLTSTFTLKPTPMMAVSPELCPGYVPAGPPVHFVVSPQFGFGTEVVKVDVAASASLPETARATMSATTNRIVAPKDVTSTRETRSERGAGPAAQRSDMLISLLLRVICLADCKRRVCDAAHKIGRQCAENQRDGAIRPPSRRPPRWYAAGAD